MFNRFTVVSLIASLAQVLASGITFASANAEGLQVDRLTRTSRLTVHKSLPRFNGASLMQACAAPSGLEDRYVSANRGLAPPAISCRRAAAEEAFRDHQGNPATPHSCCISFEKSAPNVGASIPSPEGTAFDSPGRQPWVMMHGVSSSPNGAKLGAGHARRSTSIQTSAQTVDADETDDLVRGLLATPKVFAAATEKIRPTLVTIESFGGVSALQGVIGGIRKQGEGNTTGVVISPDGYVVTSSFNFIQQPNVITVVTSDGQRKLAKLLGRDDTRQICLLKIDNVSDLPVPEFVDPSEVQVGHWAMSVGVGYGDVNPAVSLGIISAKNRAGGRAIQTDANISPANYGGPLIDAAGRLIGICVPLNPNSLDKGAGVEWYDSGIGFAIPLFGLGDRLQQMKEGKNFFPAYLGVVVATTGEDQGVRVEMVDSLEARRKAALAARDKKSKLEEKDAEPEDESKPSVLEQERPEDYDYPAFEAGILAGDVILALGDHPVMDTRSLRITLGRMNAGDRVDVHVRRGDQPQTISVELGRPPKTALTQHQLPAGPPPGN